MRERVEWHAADGTVARPRDGDRRAVRIGARAARLRATLLNLVGHLSGIATMTRGFVEVCGPCAVLDTRKTTPGLRALEKAAVVAGGGTNHRFGLYDRVLVKDNHLALAGSGLADAVRRSGPAGPTLLVEVEADDIAGVRLALAAGADWILLDNMDARRWPPRSRDRRSRPDRGVGPDGPRAGGRRRRKRRRRHQRRRADALGARCWTSAWTSTSRPPAGASRSGRTAAAGRRAGRRGALGAVADVGMDDHPDALPSAPGTSISEAQSNGTPVRPISRAATAGNSARRSGVVVKIIEMRSSAVEVVASEQLAQQLRGRRPDRIGGVVGRR